jgi:cell division septum initiation protein DivIVA
VGCDFALRGYDTAEVDAFVERVELALTSTDQDVRAAALEYVRRIEFPVNSAGTSDGRSTGT